MFIFGCRDLRALCSTGVPVSFGGVSLYPDGVPIRGLFDRPVQMRLLDGGIGGLQTALPVLSLPFNAFNPMPDAGDSITVDGTAYTVEPPTTEDDGAFLCYELNLP